MGEKGERPQDNRWPSAWGTLSWDPPPLPNGGDLEMALEVDKLFENVARARDDRDSLVEKAKEIAELNSYGTPKAKPEAGIVYAVLALVAEMELVRSEMEEIKSLLERIEKAIDYASDFVQAISEGVNGQ